MGLQIEIFATKDDLVELLHVAAAEGARAVSERVPPGEAPELADPEALFRSAPRARLYLLPPDLAAVEIMAIDIPDQPGSAKVNVRTSPVVELLVPVETDDTLRSGRLYVALDASDPLFPSVERLYDRLVAATNAWPRGSPLDVRIGPHASNVQHLQLRTGERVTVRRSPPR